MPKIAGVSAGSFSTVVFGHILCYPPQSVYCYSVCKQLACYEFVRRSSLAVHSCKSGVGLTAPFEWSCTVETFMMHAPVHQADDFTMRKSKVDTK